MFNATTSNGEGSDFWSNVKSGASSGISTIFSEILPSYTAGQLGMQRTDQLANPTYNPTYAAPRLNDGMVTTADNTARSAGAPAKDNTKMLLIGGGVVLGLLAIWAISRR